jgi:choline-sulfatase
MPDADARPNLLYIHSDQHAAHVLGCYGDPVIHTPHLDGLAARGVTFESVYCPSPICVPSRMATLTGRHVYENDCWTNDHALDSGIPTLAHALGAAGYWPVLIGRMHARGPDQLHGYAERLVGDHSANHPGGTPDVDHGGLKGTQGPARVSLAKSGAGLNAYEVHDECVAAATVARLEEIAIQRRSGVPREPFCLSVGFMLPHQPFVARRADYARYEGRVPPPHHPEPYGPHLHPHLRYWRERCGITDVTEAETQRARAAYWALVNRVDDLVGQILGALERHSLAENTLIVYSSDHGEQAGEHGLWWKQTFYEESARVPLIVSWPGRLPQGQRRANVTSALDVNATILDALSAPPCLARADARCCP